MTLTVRRVDGDDEHDTLLDLHKRILPSDIPAPLDDAECWLAFDNEVPVAFAIFRPESEHQWALWMVGVLPSHRGQGLQKRLMRAGCAWLTKQGVAEVVTYTKNWNSPSINSLIACGFKSYQYDGEAPSHFCYWQKTLGF